MPPSASEQRVVQGGRRKKPVGSSRRDGVWEKASNERDWATLPQNATSHRVCWCEANFSETGMSAPHTAERHTSHIMCAETIQNNGSGVIWSKMDRWSAAPSRARSGEMYMDVPSKIEFAAQRLKEGHRVNRITVRDFLRHFGAEWVIR
jgi:hypothetical protein